MARSKKEKCLIQGTNLIARGDIIKIMDNDQPISCRVISCLIQPNGSILATVEILEGPNQGERMDTVLRTDCK